MRRAIEEESPGDLDTLVPWPDFKVSYVVLKLFLVLRGFHFKVFFKGVFLFFFFFYVLFFGFKRFSMISTDRPAVLN